MRNVLLVSGMERPVRHWWRGTNDWLERGHRRSGTVRLDKLPVAIAMDELYDGILPE